MIGSLHLAFEPNEFSQDFCYERLVKQAPESQTETGNAPVINKSRTADFRLWGVNKKADILQIGFSKWIFFDENYYFVKFLINYILRQQLTICQVPSVSQLLSSMAPHGVTRPQWVNKLFTHVGFWIFLKLSRYLIIFKWIFCL